MNLSTLFGLNGSSYKVSTDSQPVNGSGSTGAAGQDVKNLQPGQTIQAEVVSVKGNEITIALTKDIHLQARMDQEMPLVPGQSLTFEVKSNGQDRLALSPLYENLSQDPNALKALQAAGLPQNEQTIQMVRSLMNEGLPIDKNSLLEMNRQMMTNPGVDSTTLAQMNRLQIPVTPENIAQFEAYKNYEHQISQSILDIADGLTDTSLQMLQEGDVEGMVTLNKEILELFAKEGMAEGELIADDGNVSDAGGKAILSEGQNINTPESLNTSGNEGIPTVTNPESAIREGIAAMVNPDEILSEAGDDLQIFENIKNNLPLNANDKEQLLQTLKDAGFSLKLLNSVANNELDTTALLRMLNQELQEFPENFTSTKLSDLFGSKEYGTLLKDEISRQWLLKPEEVAGERKVEELYKRLSEHTEKITNALSQTAKADSPLAGNVNQLTQNVNFMNQLNQMFTYVQLPLKMNGENTHGELYVYTNKKSLAKKDGNVSALLHLDMDHLGPVDVHVSLHGQKVATKFYLQDESAIDFVAAHMHILNERLEKRGYSMQCELIEKEQPVNVMEEILEKDKNISLLSNYSFDARA